LIASGRNGASSTKSPRAFRAVPTSRHGHPAVATCGAAMRTVSYFRAIPDFNYSNLEKSRSHFLEAVKFGDIQIAQLYYIYKYI
jgi:hypothetical protein